jgi:hypothetical protein
VNPATLSALRLDGIYVRIMCEVLDAHGLDSRRALQQLAPALRTDSPTVTAEALIALRRAFVALTDGRRELWSIVAGRYTMETTPSYGLASRTAQDLEGIVRVLALNDLHSSFAVISPIRDDNGCLIGVEFDTSSAPADLRPFERVLALVSTIRSWDSIWAGRVPYRRLELPPDVSCDAIGRHDHARVADQRCIGSPTCQSGSFRVRTTISITATSKTSDVESPTSGARPVCRTGCSISCGHREATLVRSRRSRITSMSRHGPFSAGLQCRV